MSKQKVSKRSILLKSVLAIVLAFALFGTGAVAAKYIMSGESSPILVAKEFYFTSNFLTNEGKKYVLNSGVDKFTFTLNNHADALRYSEDKIDVTVSIYEMKDNDTEELKGQLYFTGSNEKSNPLKGQIENGAPHHLSVSVSSENLQKGKEYRIVATGSAGYSKTLSAVIQISSDSNNLFKNVDNSQPEMVLLTVWTEKINGDLTIGVPKGLIPDESDPVIKADCSNHGCEIIVDESNFIEDYSSKTYRFFKENINDEYDSEDFDVYINYNGTSYSALNSLIK